MKYSLITDYSPWGRGKDHIAIEFGVCKSFCGKTLGFNYSPATDSGYEGADIKIYTYKQLHHKKNLCKHCYKIFSLTITNNQS